MKKNLNALITGFFALTLLVAGAVTPGTASAQVVTLSSELEFGMTGDQVTRLQAFLAADSLIYPEGLVTGYFGPLTRAAVMHFQARYGIPQVGRVGPITLARINGFIASGAWGNGVGGYAGDPTAAPTIYNIRVDTNTQGQLTVSWNTDEMAQGMIHYSVSPIVLVEAAGPGAKVGISGTEMSDGDGMTMSHSATISGLASGTVYYFVLHSVDVQNNESVSLMQSAVVR